MQYEGTSPGPVTVSKYAARRIELTRQIVGSLKRECPLFWRAKGRNGSAVIRRAVGELSFDLTGTMFEAGRLVRASYSHHGHRQCQLYPDTGRWRRGRVRARATAMCPRP